MQSLFLSNLQFCTYFSASIFYPFFWFWSRDVFLDEDRMVLIFIFI